MPAIEGEHTDSFWSKVDAVIELILNNDRYLQSKRNSELMLLVREQLNVSEATAYRYIGEAKKEIRKIGKVKRIEAYNKALRRREYLQLKSKDSDKKLALEILKDSAKLEDLYPDEKVQNENINFEVDLSKLTEKGLERIKRGDDPRVVLLDPESVKIDK